MYPDVVNLRGGGQTIQRRLAEMLPKVGEEIPDGYFEAMLDSMPDRVQAVIDSKGGTQNTSDSIPSCSTALAGSWFI